MTVHDVVTQAVKKAKWKGDTFCVVDLSVSSMSRKNFMELCSHYRTAGFEVIHYSDENNYTMELGWKKTFFDKMMDFFRKFS